jgi:NDP-sugar pyrophosphorylase family protein
MTVMVQKMKAFILAAGLGTRLRPLGLDLPKVMMSVGGQPLLQHHLRLLRSQGITDLVINLHYLPEVVMAYFGDGSRFGVKITWSHEEELLGTAGAVKRMEDQLREERFLVIYGDNLIRLSLAPLVEFHGKHKAEATVALFESPEPWTGGVVETNASGRVTRFVEKPDRNEVSTNLINAGIFVLEPSVLDAIAAGTFQDFGKDVFPRLISQRRAVYAMKPDAYIQDIGTPERLAKAQRDYEMGVLNRYPGGPS